MLSSIIVSLDIGTWYDVVHCARPIHEGAKVLKYANESEPREAQAARQKLSHQPRPQDMGAIGVPIRQSKEVLRRRAPGELPIPPPQGGLACPLEKLAP